MSTPARHIGRTKVQLLPFSLASRCWREVNLTSLPLNYQEKPQYTLNTRPHTYSGRLRRCPWNTRPSGSHSHSGRFSLRDNLLHLAKIQNPGRPTSSLVIIVTTLSLARKTIVGKYLRKPILMPINIYSQQYRSLYIKLKAVKLRYTYNQLNTTTFACQTPKAQFTFRSTHCVMNTTLNSIRHDRLRQQ